MKKYIIALDQGTTSTRTIIFDERIQLISKHQIEIKQIYPHSGWVEHDPEEIWRSVIITITNALSESNIKIHEIVGMGIANQRETIVFWNKQSGQAITNAIVWQDRRSADICSELQRNGYQQSVKEKTGLLLDPYFSASKITWVIQNNPEVRRQISRGECLCGTIDSFLLWRLSKAKVHRTDITNASRTLLFNIHTKTWDKELLELFNIPQQILPEVFPNLAEFGFMDANLFGKEIPIFAMAGDQQAALIGQTCFEAGMLKSTYGTGCFVLMNTGAKVVNSRNRLLSTIAYQINNEFAYGLEGSIFVAGAAVKWLKDSLKVIHNYKETEKIASSVAGNNGVYMVPAFTGLGAPYWDPYARGAILGLTLESGIEHIVRAALEAVCYQTRDLLKAMIADSDVHPTVLRVDGGMTNNDWILQFLANIINISVEKPMITETTALGVAYLVSLGSGINQSLQQIRNHWLAQKKFNINMSEEERQQLYKGWQKAVAQICIQKAFD